MAVGDRGRPGETGNVGGASPFMRLAHEEKTEALEPETEWEGHMTLADIIHPRIERGDSLTTRRPRAFHHDVRALQWLLTTLTTLSKRC